MVRIAFEPPGVTVDVEPGTPVLEAARRAGIAIMAPCGGRGTCGKCAVRVLAGNPGPPDSGPRTPPLPASIRLGCLMRPTEDVTVRPVNVIRPPRHDERPAGS